MEGRREGQLLPPSSRLLVFIPSPPPVSYTAVHTLPRPPHLQPPSLSEWNPGRQRSHFQPVTVGLQTQVPEASHWRCKEPGGGRAQGSRGPIGAGVGRGPGGGGGYLPGGSRRAGTASGGSSGRSPPRSARSVARLCGPGSGGSAHRGPCCGRAPGRTHTRPSGRCSYKLRAGGWGAAREGPGRGLGQSASC